MTLKFNRVHAVIKVHVGAKVSLAECSGSWVIVYTNFALSRCLKESENQVLWPENCIYDLEIAWVSSGCQDACLCKMSSSWVQRFISYRENSEKNSDENNTVGRYRRQ